MTREEVRDSIEEFLGHPMEANIGTEYEHVIGFHLRPGEMLCVIKKSGRVMWEDDLPDNLVPDGNGKLYVLYDE